MNELEKNLIGETERKLDNPPSFTDPDVLYEELEQTIRRYHPSDDISLVHRAYMTAKNAHMDQKRKSGEPYVIHPLCVAIILAELELDKETIIAGLLHDIVEDTFLDKGQLARIFGQDVSDLVDGVTKLTQLNINGDKTEEQAENLRKMFLAMARDIRVILIKLADRLHNMRTLQFMPPEKQKEKARETLDIYSPIAQRLGISKIKVELDDLSLKYLEPEAYEDLQQKLAIRMGANESFIENAVSQIQEYLKAADIEAEVNGRVKHYFSIYKKMVNQNKTLDQIYDLFAVRIIVETVKDCYAALGVIHEHYKPIPGRFKDYIAMPKQNMYQSLHTTLIGSQGQPFEIQIRTYEMHRTAEFGIAAHWKYKESGGSNAAEGAEADKLNWLRQILEWQRDTYDNKEFLNFIKTDLDLFSDYVYCFTPTGDVKTLPAGSTPIDFAYSIHSAVGNKMVGARANGQLVNIDYRLQSGDRIEIITSQNSRGPSRDWLKIVKSTQARNKINQWFRTELKEENIVRGRELMDHYCKAKGITLSDINKPEIQEKVIRRYAFQDWDSVLAAIGHGGLKEGQIVNRMVEEHKKLIKREITDEQVLEVINKAGTGKPAKMSIKKTGSGIVVKGIQDLAVRFSRCCNPVPGDEIVGFITRGRGITIHRNDCINVLNMPEEDRVRLISAEWQSTEEEGTERYVVELTMYVTSRVGMMVDIAKVFTEKDIDMLSVNAQPGKQGVSTVRISFETHGREEMRAVIERLKQIDGVREIVRASG